MLDSQQIIKNWIFAITFIHSHDFALCCTLPSLLLLFLLPQLLSRRLSWKVPGGGLNDDASSTDRYFLAANSQIHISPHSSYCIVNSPVASALQLLRRELLHDLKDGRLENSLLVLEEGAVYRHLVGEHWIPHTWTRNSSLIKKKMKFSHV